MSDKNLILVINPGSTSTKIALFEDDKKIMSEDIDHDSKEIKSFDTIYGQYELRYQEITKFLAKNSVDLKSLKAVIGRGGYVRPVPSGTYKVNALMLEELKTAKNGEHASNLGAILASAFSEEYQIPAFITDPTVVDEMSEVAKVSGLPEYRRRSQWHPLNQKACARRAAKELDILYEQSRIIVAHMGGGITVGVHENGKGVDVNDGLLGDGPFSLDRPGGLPTIAVMDMCFKEGATYKTVKHKLLGNAGLFAHCNTVDARVVEKAINNGDKEHEVVFQALAYNIAKEIGSCATVLKGKVDAIVLTGGLAYNKLLMSYLVERVDFLGKIIFYPGGYEMEAMAEAVTRVLKGEEVAKDYN
ncbi:MAG: butyrate kinase [bacterium]|nr:butyrate kinase [bacterium]